jgi:hypothetical protein
MKERKPIAPRLKKWLKENGKDKIGEVLENNAKFIPIPLVGGFIEQIGRDLQDDPDIHPHDKITLKADIEADLNEWKEITKRWESDNNQDLKLPKLIRPLVLAFTWILLTTLIILNAFNIIIQSEYIQVFEILALTVNGAYFGARTVEKYHAKKYK